MIAQFGIQIVLLHSVEKTEILDGTPHLLKGIVTFVLDSVAEFSFLIVDGLIDVAGQMAYETIYLPFRLGQIIFFLFKIIFGEIQIPFGLLGLFHFGDTGVEFVLSRRHD